jgi:hypothetical protein
VEAVLTNLIGTYADGIAGSGRFRRRPDQTNGDEKRKPIPPVSEKNDFK